MAYFVLLLLLEEVLRQAARNRQVCQRHFIHTSELCSVCAYYPLDTLVYNIFALLFFQCILYDFCCFSSMFGSLFFC